MFIKLRMDGVMYRIKIVIFLSFVCLMPLFSQTTYYVSSSQGNDNNTGTSEITPWKTIAKVNSVNFQPGDRMLFKRSDKWEHDEGLLIKNSGTANDRIIYGTYNDGIKPAITLREAVPGWDSPGNWSQYSTNVWYMTVSGATTQMWLRLWLDNMEYVRTQGLDANNDDGTYGITSTNRFFVDRGNARLYVYATSNPSSFYSSIEYSGRVRDGETIFHTITLKDADYVTIDGLDVQGSMYSAIGLAGSDNVIIKNCNIGKYSNWAGIFGQSPFISASDNTSDNVIIENNLIDSDRKLMQFFYDGIANVEYGIVQGRTDSWNIRNNTIINWTFGIFTLGGEVPVTNHNIYNNDISAPDLVYSKAMQINGNNNVNSGYSNFNVYNNYFHDLNTSALNISSNGNKIYFNIIENMRFSQNAHADNANSGFGIQIVSDGTSSLEDNYFFNNTFYRTDRDVIQNWSSYFNAFYNNIFAGGLGTGSHTQIQDNPNSRNHYKNNIFFYPGFGTNNYVAWGSHGAWTISKFNLLDNTYTNMVISGNLQHVGVIGNLINVSNFTLSTGSPALNAGIDISSLVPEGFTDRYGNVVNRTKPDIGAVQYVTGDTSPPTLLSATLLDSTKLLLTFSEPLSSSGITSLSNYSISNGIIIYTAELNTNPANITLTTSPYIYDQNYSISVFNLQDLSGNVISSSNNTATYLSTFGTPSVGYLSKLTIIKVTASNTDDAPDKTNDGLYYSNGGEANSRWKAAPLPQWLIYDLGAAKQINTTRISFYDFQNGRIYNYSISVSNDSVNWVSIVQNAASSNQEWTVNIFNPVEARFLKLELISNNQNEWATVWETEILGMSSLQTPLKINSKIYLQGAYENSQMRSNLRGSNLIPLSQPYISGPWFYNGYETASSIPNEVVDWILVELRSDLSSSTTIAKRAAFIRSDGSIVDLDGYSPVNFYGINNGEYYIILRHRNHLSIMSANKVALTEFSTLYDFTDSNTSAYGNELAVLGDGKYGMYSGDGDVNGIVNVLDYGIVGNKLFQTGYLLGDLDLNGTVNVLDYAKTNQNLLKITNVP
ncbi:MAG: hypothetical protein A3K31_00195 [Ignavibacteria bacterium RIFOXYA12_FULL_35_25]|nr:MAG: hypothetical protein A2X60_13495 [Ignavibacteria bacterium GWF2_35_20]OGU90554.1 MAG: hypothetical protein A3K31_00195 [Ignavibacteria bacterium RIFOXYA12_FULL_35_25]OGV30921.1 MAG: hypothetical protein A2523_08035 [Ignavibacteria bacterium RIFOXYD12_FULL_36_8]